MKKFLQTVKGAFFAGLLLSLRAPLQAAQRQRVRGRRTPARAARAAVVPQRVAASASEAVSLTPEPAPQEETVNVKGVPVGMKWVLNQVEKSSPRFRKRFAQLLTQFKKPNTAQKVLISNWIQGEGVLNPRQFNAWLAYRNEALQTRRAKIALAGAVLTAAAMGGAIAGLARSRYVAKREAPYTYTQGGLMQIGDQVLVGEKTGRMYLTKAPWVLEIQGFRQAEQPIGLGVPGVKAVRVWVSKESIASPAGQGEPLGGGAVGLPE